MSPLLLVFFACSGPRTSDTEDAASAWEAPSNRWYIGSPPEGLRASGYDEGNVPPDVRFPDQFGDTVALWQFSGRLLVFEISPMWCAPCQELAEGLEEMVRDYDGTDLAYVQIVAEDVQGNPPTQVHAADWAASFGLISLPVVADTEGFYTNFGEGGVYPVLVGVSRDMVIFEAGFTPTSEDEIRTFIDDNL